MNSKISVIIPTYNSEKYVTRCLDSLKAQTIAPYEIIFVNDGSTDNTLNLLRQYKGLDLQVITIENHGQGYARNLALSKAQGDYVWFIDSDDMISSNAIERLTEIADKEAADIINFDYAITTIGGKTKRYAKFASQPDIVEEDACSILLSTNPYFTVNNLYKKNFLLKNNIRYGEGYIYEDCEFLVKAALNAKKIFFLKEELYKVIKEKSSTTNSNKATDKHYKSFLKAARVCFEYTKNIADDNIRYMNRYFFNRFFLYYARRTPKNNKKEFLHNFVDLVNEYKIQDAKNKLYNKLIKHKIFEKRKYFIFYIFTNIYCMKKYKIKYKNRRECNGR